MQIINALLDAIYGDRFSTADRETLFQRLQQAKTQVMPRKAHWDEKEVVLITYADQFRNGDAPTLQTLRQFFSQHLQQSFNLIHLLPFYPWSSDDGFSVKDYHQVEETAGGWPDVADLRQHARLMFDFVCNHMSAESGWFRDYLAQENGRENFFMSLSPLTDLSAVARPRTSPLLTPFTLKNGEHRYLWTTFSADQVDLNFAEPSVLLAMIEVLLDYLRHGADYVRLDAVGYLWKIPGTRCIHLEQTHQMVKLFRAVVDEVAPGTQLITETNVPHQDNIRYFGNGRDEAQMIYQFSLPPLVLHAIHTGSAQTLGQWAASLPPVNGTTTYFNFLASHDGIGLNPLRGILPEADISALVKDLTAEGARVSWKHNQDGSTSPYELNVTFMDALNRQSDSDDTRLQRFLLAHAILLSFPGVPAIYIQSILGSRNDEEGLRRSGQNRSINRQKYSLTEIESALNDRSSLRHRVWFALSQLIQTRTRQAAFHPDNPLQIVESAKSVLMLRRPARAGSQALLCVFNLGARRVKVTLPESGFYRNVIDNQRINGDLPLTLAPWQFMWLQ